MPVTETDGQLLGQGFAQACLPSSWGTVQQDDPAEVHADVPASGVLIEASGIPLCDRAQQLLIRQALQLQIKKLSCWPGIASSGQAKQTLFRL